MECVEVAGDERSIVKRKTETKRRTARANT